MLQFTRLLSLIAFVLTAPAAWSAEQTITCKNQVHFSPHGGTGFLHLTSLLGDDLVIDPATGAIAQLGHGYELQAEASQESDGTTLKLTIKAGDAIVSASGRVGGVTDAKVLLDAKGVKSGAVFEFNGQPYNAVGVFVMCSVQASEE